MCVCKEAEVPSGRLEEGLVVLAIVTPDVGTSYMGTSFMSVPVTGCMLMMHAVFCTAIVFH